VYHSTLGWRVIQRRRRRPDTKGASPRRGHSALTRVMWVVFCALCCLYLCEVFGVEFFFFCWWRCGKGRRPTGRGLVFKAHRRLFHSTLGLRVIKKKTKKGLDAYPEHDECGNLSRLRESIQLSDEPWRNTFLLVVNLGLSEKIDARLST